MSKLCAHGHRYQGRRCPSCERARDLQRGTPAMRGYGAEHRAVRQSLAAELPAPCVYCKRMLYPGDRWDAAHLVDGQPEYGYGPAHPTCNQRAKGTGGYRETGRAAGAIPAASSPRETLAGVPS